MALDRTKIFNAPLSDFDFIPTGFRDLMAFPWSGLGSVGRPNTDFFHRERLWSGPRIDLHEEDTKFVLTAELPGVKKEDVKINVDGDRRRLTLEAHMKSEYSEGADKTIESKDKGAQSSQGARIGQPLISERVFGQYSRSFTLPTSANLSDDSSMTAKFDNGLLKLEIPKKKEEHSKTRQILIESV